MHDHLVSTQWFAVYGQNEGAGCMVSEADNFTHATLLHHLTVLHRIVKEVFTAALQVIWCRMVVCIWRKGISMCGCTCFAHCAHHAVHPAALRHAWRSAPAFGNHLREVSGKGSGMMLSSVCFDSCMHQPEWVFYACSSCLHFLETLLAIVACPGGVELVRWWCGKSLDLDQG